MGTVAGVVLGVVFLAAGGAKLASPTWPEQARQLGAPQPVAAGIPWIELALGALLVAGVARRPLAAAAAVLLVGFTGLIGLRLSQGRRPPCACFGGRTARPIGPLTILRNLGFLALAAVAIAA